MSFPLGYTGPISGIVLGLIFGYVLENAGFGSGCKLTAQLRFQDWAVFKVMFTAILVSAGGLYLLQGLGVIAVSDMFIPSVMIWGSSIGGVLIGVGMAVGGYCPGTSIVAFFSGKLDGLVFVLGIALGTLAFNAGFDSIKGWAWKQVGPDGLTLPQLLHLPAWLIWAALFAVLVIVGYLTRNAKSGRSGRNTASALAAQHG